MSAQAMYDEFTRELREISLLSSCSSILGWDERVNMPRDGSAFRADQLALIAGMVHERFVDPKVGDMIANLEQSELTKDPESVEAVNIREVRHQYNKRTKLPKDLKSRLRRALTHSACAIVVVRDSSSTRSLGSLVCLS